jgi:hypothetical protein
LVDLTINRFRKARGVHLRAQIDRLAEHLGRDIVVLDVGGRTDYWNNVGLGQIARIDVMNHDPNELARPVPSTIFSHLIGDARDLSDYPDDSFDFVHSNSVIEHVGPWLDMEAMAHEVRRVGRAGWIQTPAWEFPIEPHFKAPILHWFGAPIRRKMLWMSRDYRNCGIAERRYHADRINLLSRGEVDALFPDTAIFTERLIFLAKSYTARWMPDDLSV